MFSRRITTTLMTTAVVAALAILAVGPAAGATTQPISSCGQTVTTNAVVTQDLDCAGPGIVVGASGITIDLKSHVLRGNKTSYGVDNMAGYDEVTVKNGVVRNFDYGVYATNDPDDFTLSNMVSSGNKGTGVYISDGTSPSIVSTTAAGNGGSGIIVNSDSASVKSSSAAGNDGEGIWLEGASPLVKSSTADGNTKNGIILKGDSAKVATATARGNGLIGVYVVGDGASITSAVTAGNGDIGIQVSGDSPLIKRSRAEANGFLGGVSDGVGPGIFVAGFSTPPEGTNVAGGNDQVGQQCFPSSLCPAAASKPKGVQITSCGQTVTEDAVLAQDLTCPGTGIFVGASGITIDLNGHFLRGNNSGPWGISDLTGFDHVTIENGVVRNFTKGIVGWNWADNVRVSNVVASANGSNGIDIMGVSAKIIGSTTAWNGQAGIQIQGDSASVTSSTVVRNGAEGISLHGDAPAVKSSSAVANNPSGILLEGDSASITASTASANALHGVLAVGASAVVRSTTAAANSGHGIDAWGDAATLKGNRAYGNGLPGGVSDGWGTGVFAGNFVVPPVGTNVARGNDDPAGCNPSALC